MVQKCKKLCGDTKYKKINIYVKNKNYESQEEES